MPRISALNDPHGTFADYEHELNDPAPVTVCCGAAFIDDTDICAACHEHSAVDDCQI